MPKIWILSLALLAARCGGSASCGANGECNPQCTVDPDCVKGGCEQDDICNDKCPEGEGADPDCNCTADKACNLVCPAGTDPDCAGTGSQQAVWPGFQGAAGTMRGKSYQVSGALVPGEYGKAAVGSTHKIDPGIRRSE